MGNITIYERHTIYLGLKVGYSLANKEYSKLLLNNNFRIIDYKTRGRLRESLPTAKKIFKNNNKNQYIKLNGQAIDRFNKYGFIHTIIYDEFNRVIYYKIEQVVKEL